MSDYAAQMGRQEHGARSPSWRTWLVLGSLVTASVGAFACGGDVTVDGEPGAGGGGGGSSSASSTTGAGASSGGCLGVPTVEGSVDPGTCSGASDGSTCTQSCNDSGNHAWQVSCSGN